MAKEKYVRLTVGEYAKVGIYLEKNYGAGKQLTSSCEKIAEDVLASLGIRVTRAQIYRLASDLGLSPKPGRGVRVAGIGELRDEIASLLSVCADLEKRIVFLEKWKR